MAKYAKYALNVILTIYRMEGHSLQIRFIRVEYSDQGNASSVNEMGSLKYKPSIHTTKCANTLPVPRILRLKSKIHFSSIFGLCSYTSGSQHWINPIEIHQLVAIQG
jgi:hypothetical protein